MTISEKVAYLKGLAEGLDLDTEKSKEGKLITLTPYEPDEGMYFTGWRVVSGGVTVTDNKVSAITLASSAKFKKYAFPRNTGSLTSNYTIDDAAGSKFVVSDLVLQFNRMETVKRIEITALAQGELAVIVKDANGKFWYLGKDEPVSATAGDGNTGSARSDGNRYTLTLQDVSATWPLEIAATAVTTDIVDTL